MDPANSLQSDSPVCSQTASPNANQGGILPERCNMRMDTQINLDLDTNQENFLRGTNSNWNPQTMMDDDDIVSW